MHISPIKLNSYQHINKNTSQSFKGEQADNVYNNAIQRIKKIKPTVYQKFSTVQLNYCMSSLVEKYKCLGVSSVAIQIINEKDLLEILGENASKYNLDNRFGVCVVVGDKHGPIEDMTNIYEAHLFLATDKDFKNLK